MLNTLLGGLTPTVFLRDYWHKRPLLIKNALPDFACLVDFADMQMLAGRDDVESRLIQGSKRDWQLDHGPFRKADFKRLPKTDWTLLIQSLDHLMPEASALLAHFSFIPHARLDDLMVSYAAPGGSVGPHFDSYDVFLLQGSGHRRWQISAQTDLSLIDDLPLKILRGFKPEQEWLLGPGDMLYLPPHYAHHGVAEDACTTYSIGFRAPSAQELAQAFLMHLQDSLDINGQYADPDLCVQHHPAEISRAMLKQIGAMVSRIQWNAADIAQFAGRYLSDPKPNVFFDGPEQDLSLAGFAKLTGKHGVALDLKTRMLFSGPSFFINGEAFEATPDETAMLKTLANRRHLMAPSGKVLMQRLHAWYQAGWIVIDEPEQ
ncbi:MAG: JmjC domain-containing protein [Thiobacillus sp.]